MRRIPTTRIVTVLTTGRGFGQQNRKGIDTLGLVTEAVVTSGCEEALLAHENMGTWWKQQVLQAKALLAPSRSRSLRG